MFFLRMYRKRIRNVSHDKERRWLGARRVMEADIFEATWSLWNLESSLTEALLLVAVQSHRNENIQPPACPH
jgi:hypothetical protein